MILKRNRIMNSLYEWYELVKPILTNEEFQKRKLYRHHGDITVYEHCVNVSIKGFLMAKKFDLDADSVAIAGLLHDFYESPWQEITIKQPLLKRHGFTHADNALHNAQKYFPEFMNPIVEDSILKHMFPLNKIPPKYKEGLIITLADKYVSMEMFAAPKSILKTLGVVKRS